MRYDFDRVELKKEVHPPTGHLEIESEQTLIRKGFAGIFSGKAAFPMDVKSFPSDADALKEITLLGKMLVKWMEQNGMEHADASKTSNE